MFNYLSNLPTSSKTLIWIAIAIVAIPVIIHIITKHVSIHNEVKYIDSEIARSSGREKAMWQKRRKECMKRLIPFHK